MTRACIWMGGTGFGDHLDGISLTFLEHLTPGRFHKILVRYPASYIYPITYAESVRRGREALLSAIRENPGSVVGGYSQGAEVVGDVVAEIDRGLHPGLSVAACALIADPSRPIGAGVPGRPAASGYGISGQRFVPVTPTFWAAAEGDPITALPPGNPLRSMADLTEFMTLTDPAAARRWGEALHERALQGRWQQWWSVRHWHSWAGATGYAYNYLFGGRHTSAYVTEGLAGELAGVVSREVW